MFRSQAMADTNIRDADNLPKTGRVNEMCQEWMVREDGALAYRLQNQEIKEHYSGNKYRNQLVREDFPKAKTEQQREQELAEQAAAVYHRMLQEQEELDNQVARQLAEKMEKEERMKKRALEVHDQGIARHLLEMERMRVERHQQSPQKLPVRPDNQLPSALRPSLNYSANPSARRGSKPMPLPDADLYTEPYLTKQIEQVNLSDDIGLPIFDELIERRMQEEKDAELARQLQEEEGSLENTLLNKDRLLAIEVQDKELAKLLQERERSKAKRARERAKQRALAKKQQIEQQISNDQIASDDSYSFPVDMVPPRTSTMNPRPHHDTYAVPNQNEDELNYSLPADVLPSPNTLLRANQRYPEKVLNTNESIRPFDSEREEMPPVRPTQLDLKSPLNRINKPRYPDPPENCDNSTISSQHINIAMAIDPTYPRRGMQSPPSFESTSSTVTTSTSTSSPGMMLPSPDAVELDDEGIAPPYMPIQGQRRTSSLEKKPKKKNKDGGCKQQ